MLCSCCALQMRGHNTKLVHPIFSAALRMSFFLRRRLCPHTSIRVSAYWCGWTTKPLVLRKVKWNWRVCCGWLWWLWSVGVCSYKKHWNLASNWHHIHTGIRRTVLVRLVDVIHGTYITGDWNVYVCVKCTRHFTGVQSTILSNIA